MITSNLSLLVYIAIGFVIPFAVDLVTKRFASGAIKSTVLLALSLASGVLVELLAALAVSDRPFDWTTALYGAATAFVTGTASFFGFARPFGLSGSDGAIQEALPGGIGSPTATSGGTD